MDAFTLRHNFIKPQPWELRLSNALSGIGFDQMRMTLSILACIPVGLGVRLLKSPTGRNLYALLTGLVLVYYPYGAAAIQAVPPLVLTYLAMVLLPRHCGTAAWFINLPYIIWMHFQEANGASLAKGELDFTGAAMVLFLKLISTAMCYQDGRRLKKEQLSGYAADKALTALPGPLTFLGYTFALGNLLVGPTIEMRDYLDFIGRTGVWHPAAQPRGPPGLAAALRRVAQDAGEALVYMVGYLWLSVSWPTRLLYSSWFSAQGVLGKYKTILAIGFTYQLRYYFAWKLAEAALSAAGLNFVGWAPSASSSGALVPQWGRLRNINFLGVQLADSSRKVPLSWNIQTGNFLRRYVYERVSTPGRKPGLRELVVTQMVSGVWHGMYPGYLLMFFGTSVWLYAAQVVYKWEANLPAALTSSLPFKAVKIMHTQLTMNYLAMAFITLSLRDSMAVWGSVHYVPLIIIFAIIVLSALFPARSSRTRGDRRAPVAGTDGAGAASSAASSAATTNTAPPDAALKKAE